MLSVKLIVRHAIPSLMLALKTNNTAPSAHIAHIAHTKARPKLLNGNAKHDLLEENDFFGEALR